LSADLALRQAPDLNEFDPDGLQIARAHRCVGVVSPVGDGEGMGGPLPEPIQQVGGASGRSVSKKLFGTDAPAVCEFKSFVGSVLRLHERAKYPQKSRLANIISARDERYVFIEIQRLRLAVALIALDGH